MPAVSRSPKLPDMEPVATYLIVGNALALLGSIWLVVTGLIKDKKKTLLSQMGYTATLSAANFVLGGYSGGVVNIVNFLRNVLYVSGHWSPAVKYTILALTVAIPLAANQNRLIGCFPIAASAAYVLLMHIEDPLKFKLVLVATTLPWAFYDFSIMSYTACAFDIGFVFSNAIGAARILADRRRGEASLEEPVSNTEGV